MLVHALLFDALGLLLAFVLLFTVGVRMPGPSLLGSIILIGGIIAISAWTLLWLGVSVPEVAFLSGVCLAVGLIVIGTFRRWNAIGHAAFLFAGLTLGVYLLLAIVFTLLLPVSIAGALIGLILLAMQCVAAFLSLSFTFEIIDVICRKRWRRPEGCPPKVLKAKSRDVTVGRIRRPWPQHAGPLPLVALHVPCHDEPIEVVAGTLWALAHLDYPRESYQVFVVDNNTSDLAVWEPIEDLCKQLDFVFLHLEHWPGYKSGALNYALAATPLDYDLIGVIDADYLVAPNYLADLVGYFANPTVAFVQTPQDYRDYQPESTFYQRACYHAYRYFFDLSMPSRNERNAIIFAGTMGLLRLSDLREIGGWDEWCVTEDAEVSLRLLARGYAGRFVNHSYGQGLMPLEFDALKRQRFRWCFGGVQILRKHWASLLPWARHDASQWEAPGLTGAQRYHYVVSGLQWFSDVLTSSFTLLLLFSGWLLVSGHPVRLPAVGNVLLLLPLVLWGTGLMRTLWALRVTRACTWAEAIGAVAILWSLSWVVTLACLHGLVRKRGVFLRTPKVERASLARALRSTALETCLGVACWLLAAVALSAWWNAGAAERIPPLARTWWSIQASLLVLGIFALLQGSLYLSAFLVCLLSLRTEGAAREVRKRMSDTDAGVGTREGRLVLIAGALISALAVAVLAVNLLPSSTRPLSSAASQTLSQLLGNANALITPLPTTPPTQVTVGPSPSSSSSAESTPSATAAGSTPTSAANATATATAHPGATVTPARATPSPRPTPPRPTPTPKH
jgi:cellulose synthase/poly-beta-1,6-N-acetylglucosamine synthase-like glycosyltransferase